MATQVVWGTLAKVSGGFNGTAPDIFAGSTDQTSAVITTAGAVADLYAAGIIKAGDVFYVNYDQDGTPGQNVFTVTATSSGSLVTYPEAVGGALLAANNLDDVDSVSTARTNLGLGSASDVVFSTLTLTNTGLHLLDTNASHDLIIAPGSNLTADRTLTITTGDAARTLDISAASVTVSTFGASLVDDASKLVAQGTLGIKSGTTATYAGGGTSNAYTATGLVSTDIVVATILASTNAVSICKAVPTADTLTITFSADPGANTTVQWHAIATV